jgi:hypothetical protein
LPAAARRYYSSIDDGFAVIDDDHVVPQQMTYPEVGYGRYGVVSVGDAKAHTYLYYGQELVGANDAASLPYRWNDGDEVKLYLVSWTTFTFKRTSPGANEFDTADTLISVINGTGTYSAGYVGYVNDLSGANPKKMIKIWVTSAGYYDPATTAVTVRRYKKPGDTTTYQSVPQPLLNGIVLRECEGSTREDGAFWGGAASLTKTFVHTPLASKLRAVLVRGFDATSQALSPVVNQVDIIGGVGFTISHSAASGSEKFMWSLA